MEKNRICIECTTSEFETLYLLLDSILVSCTDSETSKKLHKINKKFEKCMRKKTKNILTKKALVERLLELNLCRDIESSHAEADSLLLAYIDDKDIEDAFDNLEKWYA